MMDSHGRLPEVYEGVNGLRVGPIHDDNDLDILVGLSERTPRRPAYQLRPVPRRYDYTNSGVHIHLVPSDLLTNPR
jgi:hypothetical protein